MVRNPNPVETVESPIQGATEPPSAPMLEEVLRSVKDGSAKGVWKDVDEGSSKGVHTISQREREPSSDDGKVLQEITIHDEKSKTDSHLTWQKKLYDPESQTEIGWDAGNYRHDGTLEYQSHWRNEEAGPNGEPNRFHSVNYAADGKTKTREYAVRGNVESTTKFEADGTTPKSVETFVRTQPDKYFVGKRTTANYESGVMVSRSTTEAIVSAYDELKLDERFQGGKLVSQSYPITDPDGRDAMRREFYRAGKLTGWEDSTETEDHKSVVLSTATVADGKVTDQIKYNYIVPRPTADRAWWKSSTVALDPSMTIIPAGATVPSYNHLKYDTEGREICDEKFSRGANAGRISLKTFTYDQMNHATATRSWNKTR